MQERAADAERASIKYKQVEFMTYAEKKVYQGLISGVTEWGIYVEIIETKCEGMIRMSDMTDDFYEFDEKNYRVIGRRRKKIYRLGDEVQVRVKKTDVDRRTMDLAFESGPEDFVRDLDRGSQKGQRDFGRDSRKGKNSNRKRR